jgi:hypothetical protein
MYRRYRKPVICLNCDREGHTFKKCLMPVKSYGIVAFTRKRNMLKFLLIQRKDTMGYTDFMRTQQPSPTMTSPLRSNPHEVVEIDPPSGRESKDDASIVITNPLDMGTTPVRPNTRSNERRRIGKNANKLQEEDEPLATH